MYQFLDNSLVILVAASIKKIVIGTQQNIVKISMPSPMFALKNSGMRHHFIFNCIALQDLDHFKGEILDALCVQLVAEKT